VAAFQRDYPAFEEAGARLLAVSADTPESHQAFVKKLGGLPFPLASDADLSLARAYGVVDEDNKRSRRAVFVIDRDGTVLRRIDYYNPSNSSQYLDIFRALG
jgi:peroxiredoxin Q/BCP